METLQIENIKPEFDEETDSSLLITGCYLGKIKIFNYRTMKMIIQINSHCKMVNSLDIDQKNKILVSGSEDTYLNVWQLHFKDSKLEKTSLKGSYHLDDQKIVGTRIIK